MSFLHTYCAALEILILRNCQILLEVGRARSSNLIIFSLLNWIYIKSILNDVQGDPANES
jgi:hypothetical protein